jgi:opacity protein-like surface antigen
MKKLLTVIFCFISSLAFSQNFDGKLILGISGGQIDGDYYHGYHKPGLVAGGAAELKMGDWFGLQTEIYFTQKGAKKVDSLNYYKWAINYIEAPLILNCYIKKKLIIQGGAAADFFLSSRIDRGTGFEKINDGLNKTSWCYLFGVEYKISDKFGFNIRYTYSGRPINKTEIKTPKGSNYNYYTNTLSFTIRYLLSKNIKD